MADILPVLTALEGSKWNYYQAKSIKGHLAEIQRDNLKGVVLGTITPEQKSFYEAQLNDEEKNIARYETERNQIKEDAEKTAKENAVAARRANQMFLSVVFFQIGIMLSSVSALLKRKEMWIVGVILGLIAFVFLANGLFLFF